MKKAKKFRKIPFITSHAEEKPEMIRRDFYHERAENQFGEKSISGKIFYELAKNGTIAQLKRVQDSHERTEEGGGKRRRRSISGEHGAAAMFHGVMSAMSLFNKDLPNVELPDEYESLEEIGLNAYEKEVLRWRMLFQEAVTSVGEKQFGHNLVMFASGLIDLTSRALEKFIKDGDDYLENLGDEERLFDIIHMLTEHDGLFDRASKDSFRHQKEIDRFVMDSIDGVLRALFREKRRPFGDKPSEVEKSICDGIRVLVALRPLLKEKDFASCMEFITNPEMMPEPLRDVVRGFSATFNPKESTHPRTAEDTSASADVKRLRTLLTLRGELAEVLEDLELLRNELEKMESEHKIGGWDVRGFQELYQERERRFKEKLQRKCELLKQIEDLEAERSAFVPFQKFPEEDIPPSDLDEQMKDGQDNKSEEKESVASLLEKEITDREFSILKMERECKSINEKIVILQHSSDQCEDAESYKECRDAIQREFDRLGELNEKIMSEKEEIKKLRDQVAQRVSNESTLKVDIQQIRQNIEGLKKSLKEVSEMKANTSCPEHFVTLERSLDAGYKKLQELEDALQAKTKELEDAFPRIAGFGYQSLGVREYTNG